MSAAPPPAVTPVPWHLQVSFPAAAAGRVAIRGEIDLATAPILGIRLLTMMDTHRPVAIDVDLTDVTFLDCAAISVLVTVRNAAEHIGCRIRIIQPPPMAIRIFGILGLLGAFNIV